MDNEDENELGVLEFIHCLVETLDKVLVTIMARNMLPKRSWHFHSA